jgi:hypothetical protein
MISFLELKEKIFAVNDDLLDLKRFDEFITPVTDIHMLILLSFASKSGLNIENVDKGKFFSANSNDLIIEYLDGYFPEGKQLLDISLDHILIGGKSFTYRDFFDAFGPNSLINSQLLIAELELEIGDSLNVDFETDDINIRTFQELLHHLNNNQKEKELIHKSPWWKFWS